MNSSSWNMTTENKLVGHKTIVYSGETSLVLRGTGATGLYSSQPDCVLPACAMLLGSSGL